MRNKKWITLPLIVSLLVPSVPAAAFAEAEDDLAAASDGLAWTADMQFGIDRETTLMEEAGLSLDDWDACRLAYRLAPADFGSR